MSVWRVGRKVPINVYDGERPVCQCQTAADARKIVRAVNAMLQCKVVSGCLLEHGHEGPHKFFEE